MSEKRSSKKKREGVVCFPLLFRRALYLSGRDNWQFSGEKVSKYFVVNFKLFIILQNLNGRRRKKRMADKDAGDVHVQFRQLQSFKQISNNC